MVWPPSLTDWHPQRPRGSQSGREKRRDESFQAQAEKPLVPTLTGPFPDGQANAGSWLGTKNALYYGAQSANSFSWILSVSSYTTAIFSPQLPGSFTNCFLTGNEDTIDEVKNVSDAISWSNSICTEKIVSEGSQCIVNNRKFRMQQRRESKKCNSSTRQNNNFAHASSITLFCTFLCRHCTTTTWKCLISRFVKNVNRQWQWSENKQWQWSE